MDYSCHYCDRIYSCQEALNFHNLFCVYLRDAKNKKKNNNIDYYEKPLSEKDQDTLIRKLVIDVTKANRKINELQKEVQSLKQKQKISILKHLNGLDNQPKKSLHSWIRSIPLSRSHLEDIIKNDITEGIFSALKDEIDACKILTKNIPIRGFKQKKCLYSYSEDNKWILLDSRSFKTAICVLASRFVEMILSSNFSINIESQNESLVILEKCMDESYKSNSNLTRIMNRIYENIQSEFTIIDYE